MHTTFDQSAVYSLWPNLTYTTSCKKMAFTDLLSLYYFKIASSMWASSHISIIAHGMELMGDGKKYQQMPLTLMKEAYKPISKASTEVDGSLCF